MSQVSSFMVDEIDRGELIEIFRSLQSLGIVRILAMSVLNNKTVMYVYEPDVRWAWD